MESKNKVTQFDPDKFVLTKQDFLKILDRIGNRWSVNKRDNWKLLLELEGAKIYFHMKSDDSIRKLWGEIIKEINEIMIENTIKVDELTGENMLQKFNEIKQSQL